MPKPNTPSLVSTTETARQLGVSEWTVRTLAQRGELTAVRFGHTVRYRQAQIEEFIDSHTVEAAV